MIEPDNKKLRVSKQCELLSLPRSTYYYEPRAIKESESYLLLINKILDQYAKTPFYGHVKTAIVLGMSVKVVRRLRKQLGLKTIYTKPNLSIANKAHKKYPYLLKDLEIKRINQVWSSDITYIKLNKGHVYLTAIKDLYSRKLLSWSLSNSLD
jgi:putative transposase